MSTKLSFPAGITQFGIVLLTAVLLTGLFSGCACYPGYGYGCPPGICTSPLTRGPVDYVDGGPGACGANCGAGQAVGCTESCGGINVCSGDPRFPCLYILRHRVRAIGETALAIAAAPFVITGHIVCAAIYSHEAYPNCGCSNEVYYGDNCAQAHDCAPCRGGVTRGTTGCANCNQPGCADCNQGGVEGTRSVTSPMTVPATSQRQVRPVSFAAPKTIR